jgi:hypothetical protein
VHYVREAYLRAIAQGQRVDADGWAIRTAYPDLDRALSALARRVNLIYTPNLFDCRNLP